MTKPHTPLTLDEARDKHIYIAIWLHGRGWVPAGAITFNEAHGYAGFSYFESYIDANHPPLNPATLNYRDTRSRHFIVDPRSNSQMLDRTFWELLPSTGDFGHQALIARHPQYQSLNNAQKLYFLGHRMVGGLASYTKKLTEEVSIDSPEWLDDVRREAVSFHLQEISRLRQNAEGFLAMTSYGGARPKAMYKDPQGKYWIAKFNLPTDPYDMAVAEHTAMLMARAAGMSTPETQVLRLPGGENIFLTERFDRTATDRRHSLALYSLAPGVEIGGSGLKSNTGSVMATIVRRFSDFQTQDAANIVLKFLVDIGFNNTDNHLRNTRLILNDQGRWELSPVFDVIFNPRGQPHVYNPTGLPSDQNFLTNPALSEALHGQTQTPLATIEELRLKVVQSVENWEHFCDLAGMSPDDKAKIHAAVQLGLSRTEIEHRAKVDQRRKLEQLLRSPPKPR